MERLMQVIGTKFLLLTTQYSNINDCEWFRTINLYSHLNRTTFLWEYESWIMSDISNKEMTPVNSIETLNS